MTLARSLSEPLANRYLNVIDDYIPSLSRITVMLIDLYCHRKVFSPVL